MIKAAEELKNIDELQLSTYIASHLKINYTDHAIKQMHERNIKKTDIYDIIQQFVSGFSKMVKLDLIDWYNYKFLIVHNLYRLAIRFHFYIENGNLIFIIKIITVMINHNNQIKIKHNVVDVSKGVLLHGSKEIYF